MSENQGFDFAVAGNKTTQSKYEYDVNKSSIYLRPLTGVKYKEDFSDTGFFNVYIKGEELYTVFVNEEYSNKKINKDSVEAVCLALNYSDVFTGYHSNDVFQLFISSVPTRYIPDFKNVCNTRYSKTSPAFKQLLGNFYSKKPEIARFISKRLYPTRNDLETKAMDLCVDGTAYASTLKSIMESGEIETFFNIEREQFEDTRFEEGGDIYEYVKTGGKW